MDSVIHVSDDKIGDAAITEHLLPSSQAEKSDGFHSANNRISEDEDPSLTSLPTIAQFITESKQLWHLAFPLVGMYVCAFAMGIISVGFVGHLGDPKELASAALATVFANVTGYSLIVGLASVMETLCGQAFGAKQYHQVGEVLQRALAVLTATCLPILLLWCFTDQVLILLGQDPMIAAMAHQYVLWNIPGLFFRAWSEPIEKYLQSQGETLPLGLSNVFTLLLHIPLSYTFIYVFGLGYLGAGMAYSTSALVNLAFVLTWVGATGVGRKTWGGWTRAAFKGWGPFMALAIPSATMICLEWWCYEIIIVLAGLLPDPDLKVSAMSININFVMVCIMIPMGIGDGASTRVGNELGAGKPGKARLAALTAVLWSFGVGLLMALLLFVNRGSIGMVFTGKGQPEVVREVAQLVPLLSISIAFDCCLMTISGVLRGSGRQNIGAYVNLVAYYVIAIPVACVATFYFDFGVKGLWFGLLCGALCQDTSLAVVLFRSDWVLEASRSTDLVEEQSRLSKENNGQTTDVVFEG